MLTQQRLKELFHYDEVTGNFLRIKGVKKGPAGVVAGCMAKNGYITISVDCVRYYAHRLAFMYQTGSFPIQVDHIDMNRSNNAWGNLRSANNSKNGSNRKSIKGAISAFKGVSMHKASGLWRARIKVNGKEKHIGLFENEIEAAIAYDKAATQYFGEFARLNHANG